MNAHLSIQEAVAAHQSAYAADDALYGEDGSSVTDDKTLIKANNEAEIETLRAFAKLPCKTTDDVQVKLAYLFAGTAAFQEPIFSALTQDRYADELDQGKGEGRLLEECVRSLLLEARS
ncbi:hypothetical protein [Allorhizobium borbori]|uniref:Uncharacterized protein n=1 Tax=Allorhizobium borbori TaxID=485907 RepID=A0A7W6P265_9HYPH|nr:hypothetical protein [Allorhizobium borbori]MBB4103551.1 hypothetical protein [Allorhizobium borbori]